MRILNTSILHTHGGTPNVCLSYTRMLRAKGHEVIALLHPDDPFIAHHMRAGAHVVLARHRGRLGPYDLLSRYYFKRLIKRYAPELVIAHDGRAKRLCAATAPIEVPVVVVNHGRGAKISEGVDATIVLNTVQFEETRAYLGHTDDVAYLVPNAIDLSAYDTPQLPHPRHPVPRIGVMCRLVQEKGLDIFIEALRILDGQGVRFNARIAGDGELRHALHQLLVKYHLDEKVELMGWIYDTERFYKHVDIFCLPSRGEEAFGLVVLEAMAHGLPVVVTDTPGPRDIVFSGETGLVVKKEDAVQLANALALLIADKEKADRLAKAGYQKVKEHYSLEKVADILEAALQHIMDLKGEGRGVHHAEG